MPADYRLWSHDGEGVQQARRHTIQQRKYEPIDASEYRPRRRIPVQHIELQKKCQDSACSDARDRNNPNNARQSRLQMSFIGRQHRPIRLRLPEDQVGSGGRTRTGDLRIMIPLL
jgi:hypothetical protein